MITSNLVDDLKAGLSFNLLTGVDSITKAIGKLRLDLDSKGHLTSYLLKLIAELTRNKVFGFIVTFLSI